VVSSGILLIDVLDILPPVVECYIQSPDLEDEIIQKMMKETAFPYYKLITVNSLNRAKLIDRIKGHNINVYFQNIQIKNNGNLLFEGYDGIEFGIISKSISIPLWFKGEYILNGLCMVSDEW
jgi:hypothetical protein